jgi:solute carrier family 25 protein 38
MGTVKPKEKKKSTASSAEEKKKNPAASFLGGASAGLVASLLLQPFEVVKTRMQGGKIRGARGMAAVATEVVKKNGVGGLWHGVSASCVRTTAGAGLYFFLLERVTREVLASDFHKEASPFARSVATFATGASARTVAAVLLNPITVVKTRMEYSSGVTSKGLVSTLSAVAKKEGAKGLFSGLGSTVARDAPFSGLNLLVFTQTRALMKEVARMQNREVGAVDTFIAGALAGAGATFLTHPPDVIRTRVQLGQMMSAQGNGRASAPALSMASIVREEGIRALWVGSLPRVARRTIQQAITWSMFDFVSRAFGGNTIVK